MTEKIFRLLTEGLVQGYAGTEKPASIRRAIFDGKANDRAGSHEGDVYHDEWFAKGTGGGQELVQAGDEQATRLYAGGVISEESLAELGITARDVITRLKSSVRELQEKTRLDHPCVLDLPDGWQYRYELLKVNPAISLVIGYESIWYNGREVFAHGHMISPIH